MKSIPAVGLSILLSTTLLVGCNNVEELQDTKVKKEEEPVANKQADDKEKQFVSDEKDIDFKNLSEEEKNEIIRQEKVELQQTDQDWGTGTGYTSPDSGYTAKKYYKDPVYLAEHISNMWEGFLTGAESSETLYKMYVPYLSKEFRKTLPEDKEHVKQAFEEIRNLYQQNNDEIALYYYSPLEWFGKDYEHIEKQVFYRMFENKWTQRFYYKTTLVPKGDIWLIDGDEGIKGNSSIDNKIFNQ